jgi:hypothetical protein
MVLTYPQTDFATTTLNGAITNVATTMTIGTGLNIPATNGILQIDYDSIIAVGTDDGPETVYYTAYNSGTGAITGMTRGLQNTDSGGNGVAHSNGSLIQSGTSSKYWEEDLYRTTVSVRAYASAAQNNITHDQITKVVLGTELWDTGADFATSTFTAPVAGKYLVSGQVGLTSVEANQPCLAYVYINGAVTGGITASFTPPTTSAIYIPVNGILNLAATDTVELYCQNAGVADETDIVTGTSTTFLCVQYLHA